MGKKNCIICGQPYDACHFCEEVTTYTPWRRVCDSFDHYMIYMTIKSYESGITSKEDAKAELEKFGVTYANAGRFVPSVAEKLRNLLREPKKVKSVLKDESPLKEDKE